MSIAILLSFGSGKEPSGRTASLICSKGSLISALILYENQLSGEFPLVLQSCSELILVDLADNKYIGELPTWIVNKLPQLSYLRLRNNMFSGSIPLQIAELR
jgi:hypothetical protein